MFLQKFLNLIDETAIGRFVTRKEELIDQLDPDRIYIENVRAFFGIPFPVARGWCELAVNQGVFERRIALLCPQCQRVLVEVANEHDIPKLVTCTLCEGNECERYEFAGSELPRMTLYRLVNNVHDHRA